MISEAQARYLEAVLASENEHRRAAIKDDLPDLLVSEERALQRGGLIKVDRASLEHPMFHDSVSTTEEGRKALREYQESTEIDLTAELGEDDPAALKPIPTPPKPVQNKRDDVPTFKGPEEFKPGPDGKCVHCKDFKENLIARAAACGFILRGCTLYLNWFPCSDCAGMMVQAGIRRLVADREKYEARKEDPRYGFANAMVKLQDAGVEIDWLN